MIAADGGYSKIVELLIRHGANVNTLNNFGETVLLYITGWGRGNPKIIELLIQAGAKVNARDHRRKTALINISNTRVYPNIIESVELLIQAGANVHAKDRDNMTALLYATLKGKSKIVEILIREGAIKETDQGQAALRTAISGFGYQYHPEHHPEIVEMLIQAGVDVNSPNDYGRTTLMFASVHGHREIVDVLLKYGADINAKDGGGRTAMIHAHGHDEIVKILQKAKAQKL